MITKKKGPIDLLTEALATMTACAVDAEHRRDEAIKDSETWYQNWQRMSKRCKELEDELNEEIKNHEKTQADLLAVTKYIEDKEKPTRDGGQADV